MIRLIEQKDYIKYLKLINEFRPTEFTYNNFCNFINNPYINVWIMEENYELIATGTLVMEQKLIHNFGILGHIEDIYVAKKFRSNSYGIKMVNYLVNQAKEKKCYKVILNCEEKLQKFYKKCNFSPNGSCMSVQFYETSML